MNKKEPGSEDQAILRHTRRDFIRKAAYTTPVLLSLPAAPSFAQQGSGAGSGDPGTGDPGGDPPNSGPISGPRPRSEVNCDQPLTPIDSEFATNMCAITTDDANPNIFQQGQPLFEDIIVDNDAIPGRLARGDLLGTCDAFVCSAS